MRDDDDDDDDRDEDDDDGDDEAVARRQSLAPARNCEREKTTNAPARRRLRGVAPEHRHEAGLDACFGRDRRGRSSHARRGSLGVRRSRHAMRARPDTFSGQFFGARTRGRSAERPPLFAAGAIDARGAPRAHNGLMPGRETSWTLIDSARGGDPRAREEFARSYAPVVRAYFAARWSSGRLQADIDDGVQEVFVDCLREGGALARSDSARPFRPFLYGVARTVALRFEQRRGKLPPTEIAAEEPAARDTRLSVIFDRAFAVQVMREATEVQRAGARAQGGAKQRRVELLELHFQQGRSIAEIAKLWN